MHKAFQFRLYPTKEQATLINQSIGCSRFIFKSFQKIRKGMGSLAKNPVPPSKRRFQLAQSQSQGGKDS
ncbi:hypothetical protein CHM34_14515 [Paludifilum halophilum]|uniref:Transposase putative helix-turn-helix domain-containing protein n=1 Tax=Paludifilum halophilum TaxID=1642702 RepID=A0A235B4D3_9BACL|nr:hypothetical protein CHM34_14515 [Paludifilum halophilum]